MSGLILRVAVVLSLSSLCWSCSDAPVPIKNNQPAAPQGGAAQPRAAAPASSSAPSGGLNLHAPAGWTSEQVASNMRVAQYKLPHAEGDAEDASLVLYYFGQGQGGSVDANLDRWAGQMGQTLDKAHRETLTVNGLNVTLVDVSGSYSGDMTPGTAATGSKPNSRMRGAVIETPAGPYFVKLVGPAKTIGRWDQEFLSYIKSAEFK